MGPPDVEDSLMDQVNTWLDFKDWTENSDKVDNEGLLDNITMNADDNGMDDIEKAFMSCKTIPGGMLKPRGGSMKIFSWSFPLR
jgi:hypothetical protein